MKTEIKDSKIVVESKAVLSDDELLMKDLEKINKQNLEKKLDSRTQRIYKKEYLDNFPTGKTDKSKRSNIRKLFLKECRAVSQQFAVLHNISKVKQTSEYKDFEMHCKKSLESISERPNFRSEKNAEDDRILALGFKILNSK